MCRPVLFTVGNLQQLANAIPVARELSHQGLPVHLLALDAAYGQGVTPALEATVLPGAVTWSELDVPRLSPPFARRSLPDRWRWVVRHSEALTASSPDPGALVVGVDGAVERCLLSHHRRRNVPSFILWDSLAMFRPRFPRAEAPAGMAWSGRLWSRFHLRRTLLAFARRFGLDPFVPGLAAHTPVDRIFVMGRFVADALRDQGVPSPIEVTGLPRFRDLVKKPSPEPGTDRRVLYLASAWDWHDQAYLARCQRRHLQILAEELPRRGWTLRIRRHPREEPRDYAGLEDRDGVEVSGGTPLEHDATWASRILTTTSTAATETLALGRPLGIYVESFPKSMDDLALARHPALPLLRSVDELLAWLSSCSVGEGLEAIRDDFFHPSTPESPVRIANSILRSLPSRRKGP